MGSSDPLFSLLHSLEDADSSIHSKFPLGFQIFPLWFQGTVDVAEYCIKIGILSIARAMQRNMFKNRERAFKSVVVLYLSFPDI